MSFALLKNGKPVAGLAPDREKRCTGWQLAQTTASANSSAQATVDCPLDLEAAHETLLKTPTHT